MRTGANRGYTEQASVAVLIVVTVLVTASVGVGVLFLSDETETGLDAQFSYEYDGQLSRLVIVHDGGDEFAAGNLTIAGPAGNFTWAELAGSNVTERVGRGDPVPLAGGGTYGQPVRARDTIRVVHTPLSGNATVLKSCTAACPEEDTSGGDGNTSGRLDAASG